MIVHLFFMLISVSLFHFAVAETKGGGIVIFRRRFYNNTDISVMQFLLLKSSLSSYNFAWINLNVHARIGQNQQERVLQELKPRIGVEQKDLHVIPKFVKRIHTTNKFGKQKNIAFIFGELINPDQTILIQNAYYSDYRWVTLGEAQNLQVYSNHFELLRLCEYYFKRNDPCPTTAVSEEPFTKPPTMNFNAELKTFRYDYKAAQWSEQGVGIFLFRLQQGELQYLLLQKSKSSMYDNQWTTITVRLTPDEDETAAISNVLFQKAGIRPHQFKIHNELTTISRIPINRRGIMRTMSYILARLHNPEQPLHVSRYYRGYVWANLEKAVGLLRYDDQCKFLRESESYIRYLPDNYNISCP